MGPNFLKFTMYESAKSRRRGGGTVNLVENSQLIIILSFHTYGLVGFILFPKVQLPKIPSPLAKVVADTPVNQLSEGFCCPFSIWLEPVRVEILEFPVRCTRKEDECVIQKFYPFRFSDIEPWDPIFISLPCAEVLDQEGDEEAT